jgi:hypothetical protein
VDGLVNAMVSPERLRSAVGDQGVPEVPLAPAGERRSGLKMMRGHPLTS